MWNVSEPIVQTSTLDFTTSGQGRRKVSQLKTGDVVLMNALELMEWSTERTQLLICNECGIPGCSSGGWVNLRKTNDRVVLIPAFDDIELDDWSRDEYSPPKYLRKEGTPYFDVGTYESLVTKDLGFPTLNQIAPLEMREAARLAQREMPFQILGEPPEIRIAKEKASLVVAASDGDALEHLSSVENILKTNYAIRDPAVLRKPDTADRVIYLFLDAAEFTDWAALVKNDRGEFLLLEEELVVEPGLSG